MLTWPQDRKTDQWNRKERQEIVSHKYSKLCQGSVQRQFNETRAFLSKNGSGTIAYPYEKKCT